MFLDACLVCLWSWLEILDFYYLIGFVMNKVFFYLIHEKFFEIILKAFIY